MQRSTLLKCNINIKVAPYRSSKCDQSLWKPLDPNLIWRLRPGHVVKLVHPDGVRANPFSWAAAVRISALARVWIMSLQTNWGSRGFRRTWLDGDRMTTFVWSYPLIGPTLCPVRIQQPLLQTCCSFPLCWRYGCGLLCGQNICPYDTQGLWQCR